MCEDSADDCILLRDRIANRMRCIQHEGPPTPRERPDTERMAMTARWQG
jgi:hypothetical protein